MTLHQKRQKSTKNTKIVLLEFVVFFSKRSAYMPNSQANVSIDIISSDLQAGNKESNVPVRYVIKDIEKLYIEELKMIQDIIKRMASNSFALKGWTITLVVATLLIKPENKSIMQVYLAFIPLLSLWYLDAFYIRKEKLYRELHNWVRLNRLITTELLFDFDTSRFDKVVSGALKIMFLNCIRWFYIGIALLTFLYAFFSFNINKQNELWYWICMIFQ